MAQVSKANIFFLQEKRSAIYFPVHIRLNLYTCSATAQSSQLPVTLAQAVVLRIYLCHIQLCLFYGDPSSLADLQQQTLAKFTSGNNAQHNRLTACHRLEIFPLVRHQRVNRTVEMDLVPQGTPTQWYTSVRLSQPRALGLFLTPVSAPGALFSLLGNSNYSLLCGIRPVHAAITRTPVARYRALRTSRVRSWAIQHPCQSIYQAERA